MSTQAKTPGRRLRRWILWVPVIMLLFLLAGAAGFVVWANSAYPPTPEALEGLESTMWVEVTTPQTGWLVFTPLQRRTVNTGLVIYPGGRVDARAYAPLARELARTGYLAVIVPMPLNLAVFDSGAASEVVAAFPDIEYWAIGGHSLGGAMAAQYVIDNPGVMEGLALWASYPPGNLSEQDIEVVSIYGTRDGVAKVPNVTGAADFLPEDTTWIAIQGGNHAQFGYYGEQEGDRPAQISQWAQQEQTLAGTVEMLKRIKESEESVLP